MAALVEWDTVGQIFAESVAAVVVIVGAFAVGARLLGAAGPVPASGPEPGRRSGPATGSATGSATGGGAAVRYAAAAACFLVALAAVAYGIYFTVDK